MSAIKNDGIIMQYDITPYFRGQKLLRNTQKTRNFWQLLANWRFWYKFAEKNFREKENKELPWII